MTCQWTSRDECATARERAAAGTSDAIAACPVHGPYPGDEPWQGPTLVEWLDRINRGAWLLHTSPAARPGHGGPWPIPWIEP